MRPSMVTQKLSSDSAKQQMQKLLLPLSVDVYNTSSLLVHVKNVRKNIYIYIYILSCLIARVRVYGLRLILGLGLGFGVIY